VAKAGYYFFHVPGPSVEISSNGQPRFPVNGQFMGVRGLTPLLKRYAPRSLSSITAKDLKSSTLAVDASCHLNKFIHAAEPYAYPHISGFFALARFCTHHDINPIFVFDGSTRLKQKYLEQQRRAKVRSKVQYSLAFEQDRQRRLADWLSVVRSLTRDPSLPDVRKTIESLHEKGINMSGEEAAEIVLDIQHDSASTEKYPGGKQLQEKLLQIAYELRDSLSLSSDNEKYTRTVRQLSAREQSIMDALIEDKITKIKVSLSDLSAENHNQLVSLGKAFTGMYWGRLSKVTIFIRTTPFRETIRADNSKYERRMYGFLGCSRLHLSGVR
jgi:hypothetical protein